MTTWPVLFLWLREEVRHALMLPYSICCFSLHCLPSSWDFFCRSWRRRLLRCLQRLNVSNMHRRNKRQKIILESRPGKWDEYSFAYKVSLFKLRKQKHWWDSVHNKGREVRPGGKWAGKWGPSILLDFSLFLDSQTPVLEIFHLVNETTWSFVLSLTFPSFLCLQQAVTDR